MLVWTVNIGQADRNSVTFIFRPVIDTLSIFITSRTPLPSVSSLQSQNLLQLLSSLTIPGSEHWNTLPSAGRYVAGADDDDGVVTAGVAVVAGDDGGVGAAPPQVGTRVAQLQTLIMIVNYPTILIITLSKQQRETGLNLKWLFKRNISFIPIRLLRKGVNHQEILIDSRQSPDGGIEHCPLGTCEDVLLKLSVWPDIRASVELWAVGGVRIEPHCLTIKLSRCVVLRQNQDQASDHRFVVEESKHGHVSLRTRPKTDWWFLRLHRPKITDS